MFKTYANHMEANQLVKEFAPIFNFVELSENFAETKDRYGAITRATTYTAKTDDEWKLIISFYNEVNENGYSKEYNANITFEKSRDRLHNYDEELVKDRKRKIKQVIEHMETIYKPNFDKISYVLSIFMESGINSGLFNSINTKKYKKQLKSHISVNHYIGKITISDNNFGTVSFNELLQKNTRHYGRTYFKKSYINIGVVFLVHSDNTIHPYFKMRVPYSDTKKGTVLLSLNGHDKIYFMSTDEPFKNGYIDKMKTLSLDTQTLKDYFDEQFNKEIKNTLVRILKVNKSDLVGATREQLKEYFVLVEMLKI